MFRVSDPLALYTRVPAVSSTKQRLPRGGPWLVKLLSGEANLGGGCSASRCFHRRREELRHFSISFVRVLSALQADSVHGPAKAGHYVLCGKRSKSGRPKPPRGRRHPIKLKIRTSKIRNEYTPGVSLSGACSRSTEIPAARHRDDGSCATTGAHDVFCPDENQADTHQRRR